VGNLFGVKKRKFV